MDGYMTTKEAMEYLKVSRETLRRWVNSGKLPAFKGEKILRFKKDDLDKMLQEK